MCSWHFIKRTEAGGVKLFSTKTRYRDGAPYQVAAQKYEPVEEVYAQVWVYAVTMQM